MGDAVLSVLSAINQSDSNELRRQAEDKLSEWEKQAGFVPSLARILADPATAVPLRQLAGVLLRKYIDLHWAKDSDKFEEPQLQEADKSQIRAVLPNCLAETDHTIRNSAADVWSFS